MKWALAGTPGISRLTKSACRSASATSSVTRSKSPPAGMGAVDPFRRQPTTRISKPRLAIRATAWPMRPAPTMVSVLPRSSTPSCGVHCAVAHGPGDCRQAPGRGRDEQERQLGHGLIENRGRVRAQEAGRRRFALVDPLVADAESRDHAPPRQRCVERLAVGLPADDDVARAGLGDRVDQRRLFGGRRHEGEARRRGENRVAAAKFGFGDKNDGWRHECAYHTRGTRFVTLLKPFSIRRDSNRLIEDR